MDVSDDPQYGGYATAKIGDQSVAGMGPKQMEQQLTVWSLYIGTSDRRVHQRLAGCRHERLRSGRRQLHGAALLDGDALLHGDALDPLDLDQ